MKDSTKKLPPGDRNKLINAIVEGDTKTIKELRKLNNGKAVVLNDYVDAMKFYQTKQPDSYYDQIPVRVSGPFREIMVKTLLEKRYWIWGRRMKNLFEALKEELK